VRACVIPACIVALKLFNISINSINPCVCLCVPMCVRVCVRVCAAPGRA
jgi:hypothetical protein